jgi:hypothetical protein
VWDIRKTQVFFPDFFEFIIDSSTIFLFFCFVFPVVVVYNGDESGFKGSGGMSSAQLVSGKHTIHISNESIYLYIFRVYI